MDIVVAYDSALAYWRTVGPRWLRGYQQRDQATRRARRSLAKGDRPKLAGGNRRPAGCTLPIQVLVAGVEARTRTSSVLSHVWPDLPDRSLVDAGEGFFVSTPEFCFVQMASQLKIAQLVQLGFELCGTYAMVSEGPAQQREAPLTSTAKLSAFVKANPHIRGCKQARRALNHVKDGAASPMEAVLAMLLCLPYRRGGYGLEWPMLNYRIDVPPSKRKMADRGYCKGDLCWPERHLCLEYDSELYHADAERRDSDARRRGTLIALDYAVVTVTTGQVMDSGAFNRLAHQIAKLLGKRLRYEDPQFTRSHLALREELFAALGMARASQQGRSSEMGSDSVESDAN